MPPVQKLMLPAFAVIATVVALADKPRSSHATIPAEPAGPHETIEELEIASRGAGADAAAWARLGNALMQKARNRQDHEFAAAEASFRKALKLDSRSTEALVGMAWVRNSEHQFDAGKDWALKALEIDPRLQEAHALIGDHAVELGDYDEAFDHYQAALDIRADLGSYARAAHLLWLTGESTQAQLLMEKAIAAGGPHPENVAWCRVELATMQLNSGAMLAAEMQAKNAFSEAPDNPRVLALMGRIHTGKGSHDDAISFYKKSIDISPSHEALAALVDLYLVKGDSGAAEKQLAKVVEYHRASAGHAHGAKGNADEADHRHASAELALFLADHDMQLEEAVKEAEEVYKTYRNMHVEDSLAWCYYKTGEYQKARRMIERAMKWKTRDAGIIFHAGMIYWKLGDERKARDLLTNALTLNPNFHPLHAAVANDVLDAIRLKEKGTR